MEKIFVDNSFPFPMKQCVPLPKSNVFNLAIAFQFISMITDLKQA